MQNNEIKDDYILEVDNLKMHFDITSGFFKTTPLKAVDGVSFKIKRGETLGVVGESGCGKTTLGRTIMNLYKPSSGDILFDGVQISPYTDLKKIKVEAKFEQKTIRFEMVKLQKEIAKKHQPAIDEINNEYNLALEKAKKNKKTYKSEKEQITLLRNQKLAVVQATKNGEIDDITKEFEERANKSNEDFNIKYQETKSRIEKELEDIETEKNQKLKNLTVVEKTEANITQIKECDERIAKIKELAKSSILKAKNERNEKLEVAKAHHEEKILAYKKLKESSSNKVMLQVEKEKIANDYNVEKSQAIGEYQKIVIMIKNDEEIQIAKEKETVDYYHYLEAKKRIINEAHDRVYAIEASSKIRMKDFRKKCTMVFQDPYSSLNPRMTVADIIAEPLDVNKLYTTKEERRAMVLDLMKKVGLSPEQSTRYAHEFSGGQRQRIGIARSLAVNPKFIVCDEPVSALDVSIQAQVINTFEDLQNELDLTYLFIAHDLLVVRHISDRIAVMYLGKIVELAETDDLYESPLHPYTISLLSAVPVPDPVKARANKRIILGGDVPSPLNVPTGCPFRTRCPRACDRCMKEVPTLHEVKPGHFVSCLLVQDEQK